MYPPHEASGDRPLRPREHFSGKPAPPTAGHDPGSGKLFALQVLAAQLVWLALLAGGFWLLIQLTFG